MNRTRNLPLGATLLAITVVAGGCQIRAQDSAGEVQAPMFEVDPL